MLVNFFILFLVFTHFLLCLTPSVRAGSVWTDSLMRRGWVGGRGGLGGRGGGQGSPVAGGGFEALSHSEGRIEDADGRRGVRGMRAEEEDESSSLLEQHQAGSVYASPRGGGSRVAEESVGGVGWGEGGTSQRARLRETLMACEERKRRRVGKNSQSHHIVPLLAHILAKY
jgi:hypothetical protein